MRYLLRLQSSRRRAPIMPDTAWLQVVGYASAGLVGYIGGYLTLRRTIDKLEKGQDEMRKALKSLETNAALSVTKDDLANAPAPVNQQMGALTAAVAKTATKDDLARLSTSTKDDLAQLATSTKDDLAQLATREDLKTSASGWSGQSTPQRTTLLITQQERT